MPDHYDAVIIGSGQSGGPLSTTLVKAGHRTALIERVHIGGTCINEGCTPTKTMVASGRVAYLARRAADYGVHTGEVSVNIVEVRQRKRDIVDEFRAGSTRSIEAGGVDIICGEASFTGPKSLLVKLEDGGEQRIDAEMIFINTGGRPSMPPVPGLISVPALDSTTIMELDELPEHLVVLGGGYIGLEFGQLFRRFGSRVTIVQMDPQLMSAFEDEDIAQSMKEILREDGLEILLNAFTRNIEPGPDGGVTLHVDTPNGKVEVPGTHLLVAAGRKPNTEALNLEAAGVEKTPKGHVKVNDRLETNVPGIYGMGDCAGSPQFTHISYDDFRILRANLLQGGSRTTKDRMVPYVMFTDPQLGRVGLTEKAARDQGLNIKVAKAPMWHIARPVELGEARGVMKAIVDADTDQILGVAILGYEGGEIMAMLQIAMMGKLPYTTLRHGIFSHPTLAEAMNNLFATIDP